MRRILRNKLVVGVLVVGLVGLGIAIAGDVIVQNGHLDVEGSLDVSSDLYVGGSLDAAYLYGGIGNFNELDVTWDLYANDVYAPGGFYDLVVTDLLVSWWGGEVFGYLSVDNLDADQVSAGLVDVSGSLDVSGDTYLEDLYIYGKTTVYGPVDPPCVLYDEQSRDQIVELVRQDVPPDKQGGAAVFFNKNTKRLETYVANEGRFYDLLGNVVHEIPRVEPVTRAYKKLHRLDPMTGEIKISEHPVRDKYALSPTSAV